MDFSHHPKLCNKTQYAQFNKPKPILKPATLILLQQSTKHVIKYKCRSRLGGSAPWGGGKGPTKDKQPRFRGRAQFSGPQQQPTVSTCIWRAGAKCKNHFLDHYRIFSTCNQFACHSPLQWIQSIFMGHRGQTGLVYDRERSVFSATPGECPTQECCSCKGR